VNLGALSAIWARRKYLALGVLAATLAAALTVVLAMPGIYRSTATVLVARPEMTTPSSRAALTGELEARLNRISEEILSRSRLEQLLSRYDLYGPHTKDDMEQSVTRFRRDVRVDMKGIDPVQGRGTTIAFTISVRGRDPKMVADVANELAAFYVAENSTIRERRATESLQDVKREVDDAQARLDEQDRRTNEFKRKNMGQLPEQVAANLSMLERLNAQLALNNHNQVVAMERRTAMRRPGDSEMQIAASPEEALHMRLNQLNFDLAKLQRTYSDKYPDVILTKQEIENTKKQLAELGAGAAKSSAPKAAAAPPRATDSELAGLKAEDQRLRQMIAAYQSRVEIAPEREQELQQLSRDYRASREIYDVALKRYHDAQAAVDVERRRAREEFQVLEPGVAAREPAAPNRPKLLLLGVVLACAATGAIVMLAEQLDTSFHGVDDLRSFSKLPVLVTIPEITTRADRTRRRWRWRLAASAGVVGLFLIIGMAYVGAQNDLLITLLTRTGS